MQMRSFEIVRSSTDTLTSHSGLALVGRGIARTSLARDLDTITLRHGIAHSDCVISYIALLATGKGLLPAPHRYVTHAAPAQVCNGVKGGLERRSEATEPTPIPTVMARCRETSTRAI